MMKLFPSLILFLLVATFRVSAQDQPPKIAAPSIKLVSVTILVRDYDKAAKWYSENLGFEVRATKT
jgi:catechol-2,3-dioxygenase